MGLELSPLNFFLTHGSAVCMCLTESMCAHVLFFLGHSSGFVSKLTKNSENIIDVDLKDNMI